MSNWPINGNLTGKLSVGQGERGKSLEYMWRGTELGIRQEGEEEYQFVNLVSGLDGREIELQVGNGYIQWRYVGEEEWNNLIKLSALKGEQGPKGDKGEQGLTGATGPQGEKGEKGDTGAIGPKGEQGIPGERGPQGDKGERGEKGEQGERGERGPQGLTGAIGPQGIQGERGPQGERGEKGEQGIQGVAGKDGVTPDMSDFEDKINKQYETIEKKIDDHIENHPQGGGNASIDDNTISTETTWSSSKISDFVLTNDDDVIWSTVQGENLSVDYTKEGYLREVEIWGNTWQDQDNLSDIKHLGTYNEEKQGYKVEVESCNFYKKDLFYLGNNVSDLDLETTFINPTDIRNSKFSIEFECANFDDGDIMYLDHGFGLKLTKEGAFLKIRNYNWDAGIYTESFLFNQGDNIAIVNDGNVKVYVNGKLTKNMSWLGATGNFRLVQHVSFLKINTIAIPQDHLLKTIPKYHKTTLLLPCQLMKVGDIADKLYWDSSKGRYIIEKKVNIPEGYDKLIDENLVLQTPQLIKTDITEQILLPCYKDKTHLFVTGEIEGSIKAKAPVDGGKAIQSLSAKNTALNEEINTLSLENKELKQMDNELVATSWDMDFRMCAIEWSLEDLGIGQELMMLENNMKGSVSNMALSRYEQAKIMIVGGVYKKITLTKQLTTYLNRGYLTQEEYDELIALMEAKDLVIEEQ